MADLLALPQKTARFDFGAPVGEDGCDGFRNALPVVGMDSGERLGRTYRVRRHADHDLLIPVPSHVPTLTVQHEEDTGDRVDHLCRKLALPEQGAIGLLSRGDVMHDRHVPGDRAVAGAQGRSRQLSEPL